MQAEKLKGRDFWDANPVGGRWSLYKKKVEWALDTEFYVYELLTDELLKGKQVLDVGCGPGVTMTLASKYCSSIIGLDYSEISLREAKSGFEELGIINTHLLCGDVESLPFPNSQFDVVYCIGVLHHTPDTQKTVCELYRVLKPDGKAVVMIYRAYSPKWIVVKFLRTLSRVVDKFKGEDSYIANWLRRKYQGQEDSRHGTALLELFGCPTLKMFSKGQVKEMFSEFKDVKFQGYQPGFTRLLDFMPCFLRGSVLRKFFNLLDRIAADILGFYLVIRAKR